MRKEKADAATTLVYSEVTPTVGFGLSFFFSAVTDVTAPDYSAETDAVADVTVMTNAVATTAGSGSSSCSSSVAAATITVAANS